MLQPTTVLYYQYCGSLVYIWIEPLGDIILAFFKSLYCIFGNLDWLMQEWPKCYHFVTKYGNADQDSLVSSSISTIY